MKKYVSGFILSALIFGGLPAVAQGDDLSSSVLVCRAHQCANASYSMTKGFLFNKIAQMMEQNIGKTVLVCEADPNTHVCLREGLSVPADTSYSPIPVTVQRLKLVDEKKLNGATGLDLVLDYQIKADKIYPPCQLALSRLTVNRADQVELTTRDFTCNITETGQTSLNATYNINYLDFDYGFIGAYYTIGIGEAVRGDRTGYALFRFTAKPSIQTEESTFAPEPQPPVESVVPQPAPQILRETAPQPVLKKEIVTTKPVVQKVEVPLPPPPQEPAVEVHPPVRIVPEIVIRQEPAPESSTYSAKPRIIKTKTIERTVITSDGKRQITPPEIRTFIDGIEQK